MRLLVNATMLSGHLGGIGQSAFHLLVHLRRARPQWKIALAISAAASAKFRGIDGVEILALNTPSFITRFLRNHLFLRFTCSRFDVLHNIGNMGMIGCPIPQVITVNDCYESVSPERFHPLKRAMMRFFISQSGREAKSIIAISKSTAKDLARFYPHLESKTRVIYYGNRFESHSNGLSASNRAFLFVGTLEPGKNLELLLRAMAALPPGPATKLNVIGGQGWKQSHLPELIRSLKIDDRVSFLGYLTDEDLVAHYRSALALVLPSNYEGFGLPVIEAMACGCPTLLADNSSLPEAGGDAALYFKTGDLNSLVSQMRCLRDEADLRQRCIERGLRHASIFKWSDTAEATAICLEDAALL